MKGAVRHKPAGPPSAPDVPLFDQILFYILLAVLCARPLFTETYEFSQISFLAGIQAAAGPTPATIAWLDALLLATAALALATRRRWRRSPVAGLAIALLAAAVVLSTLAAANRPLALLAGANLVVAALAGGALGSLLRTRWMLQLLVAALLASGGLTAVTCVRQYYDEFPEMRRMWEESYKPQLIEQGHDPNAPEFINYERRMRSDSARGYLVTENVSGSCLGMWLLVTVGLAAGLARRAPAGGVTKTAKSPSSNDRVGGVRVGIAALVAALLAFALWLTGSLGALVATIFGAVALLLLGVAARWCASHARGVLALLLTGYVAVMGLVAAYGLSKGTLPHPSLAFRWYYWTGAARAFQEVPLSGIGRENFRAAYLRYKPAESTEEVKNPHSLWVSLLVELGPLGAAAGALLCALCVWAGLRSLAPPGTGIDPRAGPTVAQAAPVVVGVLFLQATCSGTRFDVPAVAYVWTFDVALAWALAFAVALWLLRGLDPYPRRITWLAAGLSAALLAALVHNLVSFAVMTPGGLAVFVLCALSIIGLRSTVSAEPTPPPRSRGWECIVPPAVGACLVAGYLVAVARPIVVQALAQRNFDTVLHSHPHPDTVLAAAHRVVDVGRGDWAGIAVRAVVEISRQNGLHLSERLAWLHEARHLAETVVSNNPRGTTGYRALARVHEELAWVYERQNRPEHAREAWEQATDNWQHAVEWYPTNPRTRISAGTAWFELWRRTGASEAARRAREHFEEALWIDDRRPLQDVVRLRPQERGSVNDYLSQLGTAPTPRSNDLH